VKVHFSGAAVIPGIYAAHPLMTFGEKLHALDWYEAIPFVTSQSVTGEQISVSDLLPGLKNRSFSVRDEDRGLYHALCSLAGNFSFLLWQTIGQELENKLQLPREIMAPFLHQVVDNAFKNSGANFTGPVARGDWSVVESHIEALALKPGLRESYESYLQLWKNLGNRLPEKFT
jgi:predicted short-subunit dehydrogenase-like oxidoreductase (DUF2520 family)